MDLSVIYFNDQDEDPILDVLILTRRQLDKFLSKQDIDLILFNYNSFNSITDSKRIIPLSRRRSTLLEKLFPNSIC